MLSPRKDRDVPKEFRVLCETLRRPLCADRLRELLIQDISWPLLIAQAKRHRIVPVLYAGLKSCADVVPPGQLQRCRDETTRNTRAALAQAAELGRVLNALEQGGIRALVLKGIVLSQQLYGDPGVRGVGDMDILVPPDQFWQADQILAAAGYHISALPLTERRRRDYLRHFKELHYRHRQTGALLELHQRLTDNPGIFADDFDRLWAERELVTVCGRAISTLPRAVLRPFLGLHGAWHGWERLRWLADFAVLAQGQEAETMAEARQLGLTPAVQDGLALASRWLGNGDAAPTPRLSGITGRFFAGAGWGQGGALTNFYWHLWRRIYLFSLVKRSRYRWREFLHGLHNPDDWALFRLPDRLFWLYVPLRPFGWMIRWGLAFRQGRRIP